MNKIGFIIKSSDAIRGEGVFTTKYIKIDTIIGTYDGEKLSEEELNKL